MAYDLIKKSQKAPGKFLIGLERLYQRGLSPLLGNNCRFHPTCSQYMIQAVEKHGAIRGALKGIWRIFRCHPFSRGGYDPP
ncbi:MAG TPA: membrane protein insertion efficiency factor YidD [Planctomycetaceae bacterium]|nr:membrane protein insertion efficiency factor YidD [Planctomycetaceae bacterium]